MCRVNSCCCGCSLRTGSLVIGILDLISSTTLFIGSILLTSLFADNYEYGNLTDVYLTLAVITGILLIADILLLIGVVKGKPSLIAPWIAYSCVNLFTSSAGYVVLCLMYLGLPYGGASSAFSFIATAVVSLGFKVYFIVVVQSHYSALKRVTYYSNDVQVTAYAVDLPQPYPNGQPQFYPNVNLQQMGFPNEQQPYTGGQQQMYQNDQQTYPNSQSFYPSNLQHQYPGEHQQRFQNEQQRFQSEQPRFPRVQPQRLQNEQKRFQNEQQRYRSGPQHYVTYPNSGNRFHPDADQEFPSFNAPNVRRFEQ